MKIPHSCVVIGERQRLDLGNIESLAESIQRFGQINSITVSPLPDGKWKLETGRRRLEACRFLNIDVEAKDQGKLTPLEQQLIEFEEDFRRKARTWQEEAIAICKLHTAQYLDHAKRGEKWTLRLMEESLEIDKSYASIALRVGAALAKDKERTGPIWQCGSVYDALKVILKADEDVVAAELDRRRRAKPQPIGSVLEQDNTDGEPTDDEIEGLVVGIDIQGQVPLPIAISTLTLFQRADLYNRKYPNTPPLKVCNWDRGGANLPFIYGFWFTGGQRHSEFYGSYHIEYLERIYTMFPEIKGAKNVVHLFSGSLPASPDYTRVGIDPSGKGTTADIIGNAESLSSFLPFHPQIIYADPPYSVQEAKEEYKFESLVNGSRVLDECGSVLQPGGYVVWLDQMLPVFSNKLLRLVGVISYVRSTGNRFRCICIFQKTTDENNSNIQ